MRRPDSDWVPVDTPLGRFLRALRFAAVAAYLTFLVVSWHVHGVPLDRERLLLWLWVGLGAACIGRHPVWLAWALLDFAPFALVLVAYDYLSGIASEMATPTWWEPQIAMDRLLFIGREPTVWLQEHLKHSSASVRWYDVLVCISYFSFFFLPYVTAAAMWLFSRADFYRWSSRFVGLSFFSFLLFVVAPAAPPWAAALCTSGDVSGHPHDPTCMHYSAHPVAGNLLGTYVSHVAGAHPYVERIAGESFYKLHLGVAHALWAKGFATSDAVAAIPSLHMGGTILFCLFMWRRVGRAWRPLLFAYPLVMQFSLTYAGEHYVVDGIAGGLAALLVDRVASAVESRIRARRALDRRRTTLEPRERPERVERDEARAEGDSVAEST